MLHNQVTVIIQTVGTAAAADSEVDTKSLFHLQIHIYEALPLSNCTIAQCKEMFCFGVPAFLYIYIIVRKNKTSDHQASRGG